MRYVGESQAETLLPPPPCPDDKRVTRHEFFASLPIFIQASLIGVSIGTLPGTGATTAAYLSYGAAKRRSNHLELFGKGSLEGITTAEAGNNKHFSHEQYSSPSTGHLF